MFSEGLRFEIWVIGVARWLRFRGIASLWAWVDADPQARSPRTVEVRACPLKGIGEGLVWSQPCQLRRPRCRLHTEQQVRRGGNLTDLLNRGCLGLRCDEVDDIYERVA
ncbi:hypothetical protein RHA1_ro08676 (plasmid) [Rhodococcus jostii RHA1]|uniref:Uncharacterized protein n=1 Tax=Rhodococcus jostii (strain RHA1) TaxID=101510 RepID=Q0RYB6_RHOJR|nr:hypothetical protein RHA1_ro08676 [Rhodococcus jostii RHA1]